MNTVPPAIPFTRTDSKWVLDKDQFSVNQFGHPYGGTVYFGLARSSRLNFWESWLYTGAGSFLWEIAGEKTLPSINDQITTTFGGTFLGEPLFRMANLLLESGDNGKPGFWRELAAAVISPPTGFNRLAFGNRFDEVYPSHNPATFLRLQVGGTLTSSSQNVSSSIKEQGATGALTFTYGLPGKPGYTYTRPFDYFDVQLTSTTANTIQSIETRGLLIGTSYASGDSTRGIWGLYGSYDYIAPQIFRVSTTALSLGTTWQTWLSQDVALQGTSLGGVGYGAAGSVQRADERDYHYGATPQALLALRLILGERAMLDVTGREYIDPPCDMQPFAFRVKFYGDDVGKDPTSHACSREQADHRDSPSCDRPGNPLRSNAENPRAVATTPRRIVGQISFITAGARLSLVRWLNRWMG